MEADAGVHPRFSVIGRDVSGRPREANWRPRGKGSSRRGAFDSSYCSCLPHLARQSHPGRRGQNGSVLNATGPEHPSSLSVSLSVFVFAKAQTSHFNTRHADQRSRSPTSPRHSTTSTTQYLCNTADTSLYGSFSLRLVSQHGS